jgi:hypothetical protein
MHDRTRRGLLRNGVLVTLLAAATMSCDTVDKLLEANNPAEIREDMLDDAALANVLANSVIGALTQVYADPLIWRGSMITDEQVSGINWEGTARVSQRILPYTAGDANTMFRQLSRMRFLGDSISSRFDKLLPEPNRDRRMALVLAHAGYAYTLMAETLCGATIDVGSKIYSPMELAQMAIPRFERAIEVATAAGTSANDVRNLARVGLARAALLTGDKAKVMAAASQVPLDFTWWVEYRQGTVNFPTGNIVVTGSNHNLGVHPRWLPGTWNTTLPASAVSDPRMQHRRDPRFGHNQLTRLYTPFQSLPYSGYNGQTLAEGGAPIHYDQSTNIKLASGLEAMHHYYEAAGPARTGPRGTTLEFVNERRTYGRQTTVELAGEALMSELRTQRFKDNWLGGFRLGDLRRYAAQGINDPLHTFPSGPHPNASWGDYGDATCYPVPIAEYTGNPNIKP